MTTLANLVLEAREELQETGTTAGQWKDAELKRWAQEANDDLTRLARIEAAPTTIATVADTESYALPADFSETRKVELKTDESSWFEMARSRVDERVPAATSGIPSHKGTPTRYFVWNDRLYLIPVPDGVYTLNLWYYEKGNTLSADGDEPVIPSEFHWILKLYMCARAKRKVDDPAYTTYAQDYSTAVADMRRKLRSRRLGGRFKTVLDVGR